METHFRVLCSELEVEIKGQELKCAMGKLENKMQTLTYERT